MKYLFIGDLHGNYTLLKNIVNKFLDTHTLCFIGDYCDSFHFTITEQFACVRKVLELCEKHPDKIIALWGNHDYAYIHPQFHCPGTDAGLRALLYPLMLNMHKHFKLWHYDEDANLLVTHAGLTDELWKEAGMRLDNFESILERWSKDIESPLFWIGPGRYGNDRLGGILWSDYLKELKPITELIQVVGHTAVHNYLGDAPHVRHDMNKLVYNIDCLPAEVLEYDTVEEIFTPIKL